MLNFILEYAINPLFSTKINSSIYIYRVYEKSFYKIREVIVPIRINKIYYGT